MLRDHKNPISRPRRRTHRCAADAGVSSRPSRRSGDTVGGVAGRVDHTRRGIRHRGPGVSTGENGDKGAGAAEGNPGRRRCFHDHSANPTGTFATRNRVGRFPCAHTDPSIGSRSDTNGRRCGTRCGIGARSGRRHCVQSQPCVPAPCPVPGIGRTSGTRGSRGNRRARARGDNTAFVGLHHTRSGGRGRHPPLAFHPRFPRRPGDPGTNTDSGGIPFTLKGNDRIPRQRPARPSCGELK